VGHRRRFFDSSRFGLGNGGHTFGDRVSETEWGDVIEYLKTL
jgi:tRNA(Glu) U13 pseudouridine synthase TruD